MTDFCVQSYKHAKIVNYNYKLLSIGNFVVSLDCRTFMRLPPMLEANPLLPMPSIS